jgi:tetratricopeptide (TPR) repeat protein
VGTLRYMSPEQAQGKRGQVDHRTDIYSLGVTLYELLTLEPAFAGQDRQELLQQIALEEPRLPRRLNAAIPVELETIVLKAMAKNPAERYPTAQELADDLKRLMVYRRTLAVREKLKDDFPGEARDRRDLAWFLANCPARQFRDSDRAVRLAKEAVELAPEGGDCWRTLGVARYRARDWKAAVAALKKATELRSGGDSAEWFFLAMAHWQLGDKQQARSWYDRAMRWMDEKQPRDEKLRRWRAEAAALLGVADKRMATPRASRSSLGARVPP